MLRKEVRELKFVNEDMNGWSTEFLMKVILLYAEEVSRRENIKPSKAV